MRTLTFLLKVLLLSSALLTGSQLSAQPQDAVIPSGDLLADFAVAKQALLTVHPGLFKYQDQAALTAIMDRYERRFQQDMRFSEAYRTFSELLAEMRCGHTQVNPYNQNSQTAELIYRQADKLPFTFRWLGEQMILTANASPDSTIRKGMEITAINGHSAAEILGQLLQAIPADGSNDGQRKRSLELTGIDKFEFFDIYFPLYFPLGDSINLQLYDHENDRSLSRVLAPMTSQARKEVLLAQGLIPKNGYDATWEFRMLEDQIAYLKIGSHVTWKMEMDWKQFLTDAFQEMEQQGARNLILDIRGNGGGNDQVNRKLYAHLVQRASKEVAYEQRVAYRSIPDSLRPYLNTWRKDVYQFRGARPTENGLYKRPTLFSSNKTYRPSGKTFTGQTYLLVDASNNSATHLLARFCKENEVATLVGQTTGGNQRGINGVVMFFVNLPHTRIEFDIPIVGFYPDAAAVDGGVEPDEPVVPLLQDVIQGVDTEVRYVLEKIRS